MPAWLSRRTCLPCRFRPSLRNVFSSEAFYYSTLLAVWAHLADFYLSFIPGAHSTTSRNPNSLVNRIGVSGRRMPLGAMPARAANAGYARSMALITLIDAHLAFGHVALLDSAAFSLETGERVGLIGRNGAGKSTLLKILGGLEKPDDGSVVLQSHTRITYVAQEPVLDPNATIFEAVSLGMAGARALIDQYTQGQGDLDGKGLQQLPGIRRKAGALPGQHAKDTFAAIGSGQGEAIGVIADQGLQWVTRALPHLEPSQQFGRRRQLDPWGRSWKHPPAASFRKDQAGLDLEDPAKVLGGDAGNVLGTATPGQSATQQV